MLFSVLQMAQEQYFSYVHNFVCCNDTGEVFGPLTFVFVQHDHLQKW
jgi:hypothetical protein